MGEWLVGRALNGEQFERKMAEIRLANGEDGCGNAVVADTQNEVNLSKQTSKRSSTSPSAAPPQKSPRADFNAMTTEVLKAGEAHLQTDEIRIEATEGPPVSPTARRKSWRRSAINRRSLPALPNPNQALCRGICKSLSEEKRLEKLMKASMKLALERTQHLLQSVPNASLESFQQQVEHIQKQWGKTLHSGSQRLSSRTSSSSKPVVHRDMERFQTAIQRLQAESDSWEALLNKHRSKAEELERRVEQGQKTGISFDSTSVARSSQYHLIQNKPDYRALLCKQQPMLHTMAMIIDSQCKMVRELQSIKEISQLLVKKTSGQLAAEAGFQDLSSDLLRNLMAAPVSTTAT